ncbi:MAG: trans-2-enoyl-CoA reductase family protein [Candidatus Cardinium sp.]|nr:trans-2-enoyl-CoA reductase family protein [Candidatus Cardinium sp.]
MHTLIHPKVRGYICTTAHPVGCAKQVQTSIQYVTQRPTIAYGPRKALIIGGSTGFGLASRIAAAFGSQAQTIAVFFEREGSAALHRTASAGWYNTVAFEQEAHKAGLYAKSINGDAYSDATKQRVLALIEQDWQGEIDLVVYSLASPRRIHPKTGLCFNSVLKPIGQPYTTKTIDVMHNRLEEVTIEPASDQEVTNTIAVMGGEDWMLWIEALLQANLLAKGVQTIAYSYYGSVLTYPIYREGSIGQAKKHLEATSQVIQQRLEVLQGSALISFNKALVTQASAAIPAIPLYVSLLYKVMKEKQLHEECMEQIYRLYVDHLYKNGKWPIADTEGFIRMDDWEMREDVQQAVAQRWSAVNDENLLLLTDLIGYKQAFYRLFGFEVEGVDYSQPVAIDRSIPSISTSKN